MKRIYIILLVVSTLFFASSCEDGVDGSSEKLVTKIVNINTSGWNISGNMMSSSISLPELTTENYRSATIVVYSEIAGTWQLIPYKARLHSNDGLDRLIRYTYEPGKVVVDIVDNDNLTPIAMKIKIVIIPGVI